MPGKITSRISTSFSTENNCTNIFVFKNYYPITPSLYFNIDLFLVAIYSLIKNKLHCGKHFSLYNNASNC